MLLGKSGWFLFHEYVRGAGTVGLSIIQEVISPSLKNGEFEANVGRTVRTCVRKEQKNRSETKPVRRLH